MMMQLILAIAQMANTMTGAASFVRNVLGNYVRNAHQAGASSAKFQTESLQE